MIHFVASATWINPALSIWALALALVGAWYARRLNIIGGCICLDGYDVFLLASGILVKGLFRASVEIGGLPLETSIAVSRAAVAWCFLTLTAVVVRKYANRPETSHENEH